MATKKAITYKKTGVNIDRAEAFIAEIRKLKTPQAGVIGSLGGFSGLFQPDTRGMKNPLLAAATDGVGTKLMIARQAGIFDTVGIDLVAMSANDLITCGARPLFFLDYFATGKLNVAMAMKVMKGIAKGCCEAACALIGGETAEMPGMYAKGDFDLAGFCVGLVDERKIINGKKVHCGDVVIGLASNGLHSNGFSLVRKVFPASTIKGDLAKTLLKPTRIYVKPILSLLNAYTIKAMAHITGGGFYENIPRVLSGDQGVFIRKGSWKVPEIFSIIQKKAGLSDRQMYRTFNMGIGMILIVSQREAEAITRELWKTHKVKSWIIGEVICGKPGVAM